MKDFGFRMSKSGIKGRMNVRQHDSFSVVVVFYCIYDFMYICVSELLEEEEP